MASNQGFSEQKQEFSEPLAMTRTRTTPAATGGEKGKKATKDKALDIVSIKIRSIYFSCPNNTFFFLFGPIGRRQKKKKKCHGRLPVCSSLLLHSLALSHGLFDRETQAPWLWSITPGSKEKPINAPSANNTQRRRHNQGKG
jgi:hypothetical protein